MQFVGQVDLMKAISGFTWQTMPKAWLLLGPKGCGKHTAAKLVSEQLKLPLIDLNKLQDPDALIEIQQSVTNKLYFIDLSDATELQQNRFLKLIEEPPATARIILLASSQKGLLPTIVNRCIKYIFLPYTVQELMHVKQFKDTRIYNICETPGDLLELDDKKLIELLDYCAKVIEMVDKVRYPIFLTIALRINYKEEYDKFNFDLFFKTILWLSRQSFIQGSAKAGKIYLFTAQYLESAINIKINKENFMLSYLTQLWKEVRA